MIEWHSCGRSSVIRYRPVVCSVRIDRGLGVRRKLWRGGVIVVILWS